MRLREVVTGEVSLMLTTVATADDCCCDTTLREVLLLLLNSEISLRLLKILSLRLLSSGALRPIGSCASAVTAVRLVGDDLSSSSPQDLVCSDNKLPVPLVGAMPEAPDSSPEAAPEDRRLPSTVSLTEASLSS
jgi:hypothetical protein